MVLGSLKFNASLTFAQRRIQWDQPDSMTREYKIALASSFVGEPLVIAAEGTPSAVITPSSSQASLRAYSTSCKWK